MARIKKDFAKEVNPSFLALRLKKEQLTLEGAVLIHNNFKYLDNYTIEERTDAWQQVQDMLNKLSRSTQRRFYKLTNQKKKRKLYYDGAYLQ